jgi:hypothetical protein
VNPRHLSFGLIGAALLAGAASAQSNVIPGTDVSLGLLDSLSSFGHVGTFPNGNNAFAMATTSCNLGSVNVPWLAPMEDNHPLIAFTMFRVEPGQQRIVQISDYSYLKHGFFALSDSQCIPCQNPSPGTFLGVGCSDTYSEFNNSDNFWLGPAEEIDPWLGTWDPVCSFFDAGLNPTPPFDCDGNRSFSAAQSNSLGPLGNRMQVSDQDLSVEGATYFYQGYYVIKGEPEANRENNLAHRRVFPTWSEAGGPFGGGPQWQFTSNTGKQEGSVLQRWNGSQLSSNTNGNDDGRVYVAVKVSGPNIDGLYHYEYALHNRDNNRAVGGVRLPVCDFSALQDVNFIDLNTDGLDHWTAAAVGGDLEFTTTDSPLRWNSVYNFYFDSPNPPENGAIELQAFFPGPGAASFSVPTLVPAGDYLANLGSGCSEFPVTSRILPVGKPALGNGDFKVRFLSDVPENTPTLLYGSAFTSSVPLDPFGQCFLYLGGAFGSDIGLFGLQSTNALGNATFPAAVPGDVALEGAPIALQALALTGSAGAPLAGIGEVSDGIRLTVGSDAYTCN